MYKTTHIPWNAWQGYNSNTFFQQFVFKNIDEKLIVGSLESYCMSCLLLTLWYTSNLYLTHAISVNKKSFKRVHNSVNSRSFLFLSKHGRKYKMQSWSTFLSIDINNTCVNDMQDQSNGTKVTGQLCVQVKMVAYKDICSMTVATTFAHNV